MLTEIPREIHPESDSLHAEEGRDSASYAAQNALQSQVNLDDIRLSASNITAFILNMGTVHNIFICNVYCTVYFVSCLALLLL